MDQAEVCERDVVRRAQRGDTSKGEMISVRYIVKHIKHNSFVT